MTNSKLPVKILPTCAFTTDYNYVYYSLLEGLVSLYKTVSCSLRDYCPLLNQSE